MRIQDSRSYITHCRLKFKRHFSSSMHFSRFPFLSLLLLSLLPSVRAEFPARLADWTLEQETRLTTSALLGFLGERADRLRCYEPQDGLALTLRRDRSQMSILIVRTPSAWAGFGLLGLKAGEGTILGVPGHGGCRVDRTLWWNEGPFVISYSLRGGNPPAPGAAIVQAMNHLLSTWEDCGTKEPVLPGTDAVSGSLRVLPLASVLMDAGVRLEATERKLLECRLVQSSEYRLFSGGRSRRLVVMEEDAETITLLRSLGKSDCAACPAIIEGEGRWRLLFWIRGRMQVLAIGDHADEELESWMKSLPW